MTNIISNAITTYLFYSS